MNSKRRFRFLRSLWRACLRRAAAARKLHSAWPPPPISSPYFRPSSRSFSTPPAFTPKPPSRPPPCSTTQIENGAPFDLFLSADLGYPKRLIDAGLADAAGSADSTTPITYAKGTLVLWERKDSHLPPPSLDLLRSPDLKRLAIANPERAPYGRAAVAALESLNLYDTLKPRLVTAENIAQAAQFVDSGNADAGLISLTSALTPRLYCRRHVFRHSAQSLSAHRAGRRHREQHQAARRRAQAARLSALARRCRLKLAKCGLTPVK